MGTPQPRIDRASEGIGNVYEKMGTVSAGTVTATSKCSGTLTVRPRRTRGARPTKQPRGVVAGRVRRTTVRTAAPCRGDPDDPDPEPPWQDLNEWLSERKRALGALTGGGQLRLDGEVWS